MMSIFQNDSIGFSPRTHELSIHRFFFFFFYPFSFGHCWEQVSSHGVGLRFNQKVVGYSPNIYATISPAGISHEGSYYHNVNSSNLAEVDEAVSVISH